MPRVFFSSSAPSGLRSGRKVRFGRMMVRSIFSKASIYRRTIVSPSTRSTAASIRNRAQLCPPLRPEISSRRIVSTKPTSIRGASLRFRRLRRTALISRLPAEECTRCSGMTLASACGSSNARTSRRISRPTVPTRADGPSLRRTTRCLHATGRRSSSPRLSSLCVRSALYLNAFAN